VNDFAPVQIVNETATAGRAWLASRVGLQETNSITLDLTKFTSGVHYDPGTFLQPRNILKSGLALGKVTASGLYAPYSGPTSETQSVTISGSPTGGTFTLTFSGQTTGAIASGATAAAVQTALEALSNIAPGDVTVTGSAGGPWTVAFGGDYFQDNPAQMTATSSLTGGSSPAVTVATVTGGGTATATDGTQTLAGFLADETAFAPGSTHSSAALLWRCEVYAHLLPIPLAPEDVASTTASVHWR
jgi:hypothetical protein